MAIKTVRAIGMFFLNLLLALVLTEVLVAPFLRFDLHSIQTSIMIKDCLDAVAAFGMGYYVYRRWTPVSAQMGVGSRFVLVCSARTRALV